MSSFFNYMVLLLTYMMCPEERLGLSDVFPRVWNLRAVFLVWSYMPMVVNDALYECLFLVWSYMPIVQLCVCVCVCVCVPCVFHVVCVCVCVCVPGVVLHADSRE